MEALQREKLLAQREQLVEARDGTRSEIQRLSARKKALKTGSLSGMGKALSGAGSKGMALAKEGVDSVRDTLKRKQKVPKPEDLVRQAAIRELETAIAESQKVLEEEGQLQENIRQQLVELGHIEEKDNSNRETQPENAVENTRLSETARQDLLGRFLLVGLTLNEWALMNLDEIRTALTILREVEAANPNNEELKGYITAAEFFERRIQGAN